MRARLLQRSWIHIRPVWLSLLLLLVIILVAAGSVATARWVDNSRPMLSLLWNGAIIGVLLSLTRWRGRWVALYSLLVSLAFALQALGRVAPPLLTWFRQPLADTIWNMHLRATALGERIAGWVSVLQSGGNITDTGLFVLLSGFLLWNGMVWLAWSVVRRRRPMGGLLPFGFLLGVNIHLSGQDLIGMWIFILAGLLLVVHSSYRSLHHDWEERQVDYPDASIEWFGSALLVLVMLGLFVRISPVIGSREGWQSIAEAIERYRARAAQTTERLFQEVRPSVLDGPAPVATLPDLSSIGAPIPDSNQTILWVRTSDPPPPPPEAGPYVPPPPGHYWRSRIDATYTGSGWEPVPIVQAAPPFDLSGELPGRYLLEQEFEIVARHDGTLFAVNQPALPGSGTSLAAAQPDGSTLLVGEAYEYSVSSLATRVTASELRRAGTSYPPAIAETYLQLPPDLPERVITMAARVTGPYSSPFDKAAILQAYLRLNFDYNEAVSPPPPGRDAVDYFLFEAQEGFCTYYASAMVVMLRSLDIPARVVSGYATGAYDYDRRAYRVLARNAHAWVEVYFPEYGWVEFEPTSALPARVYAEGEGLEDFPYAPIAPVDQVDEPEAGGGGILRLVGMILGALLLAFVLRNWERWQNRRVSSPRARAVHLYWQVRRSLGRAGLATSPSTTPAEFLDMSSGPLATRNLLLDALQQATDLYHQAEYSPRPPSTLAILSAINTWQRALPQRLLFWSAAQWQRLVIHRTTNI
jgi:transglutaminase-like putative cysteine protease